MIATSPSTLPAGTARLEPVRGLYVHIPFCPAKCGYCAFVTHIGSDKLVPAYVHALVAEAEMRRRQVWAGPLDTVYFGGGTPSMLSSDQIAVLLSHFVEVYGIAPDAEITMEAHPATVTPASLSGYFHAGVNRISFGIESFQPAELESLGRVGGPSGTIQALHWAKDAGFRNIAVDLMYGIPLQTIASWERTLDRLIELDLQHVSLYPLSIESQTPFERINGRGGLILPTEDTVVAMYHFACGRLSDAGFEHYEVGSWCRPGLQCHHNLAYWRNRTYLGIGVGAHSYTGQQRAVNIRQTARYIRLLAEGNDPVSDTDPIDDSIRVSDTIMLSLRLLGEGLDLADIKRSYGVDLFDRRGNEIAMLADLNLLAHREGRLYLTEAGVPLANEVWERLAF